MLPHVKAAGANGNDDSVHAGHDNVVVDDTIAVNASNVLSWANGTAFTVSTTGLHQMVIYGREDGVRVDQVIVNQSSGTPTWSGQSPRY